MTAFTVHHWQRDERNPILPPGGGWFDATSCMNPYVVTRGDEYWLFYAGGDEQGHRRICLAIADKNDLTKWNRLGPIFDIGRAGSFDDNWCVLPSLARIDDKWHLYYTGRDSDPSKGLQSFWGMGLAVSDDLRSWRRYSDQPIMSGDTFAQFPHNRAIAGGGPVLQTVDAQGKTLYRMYYTLPTGTPSDDLLVDQAKRAVVAESYDGIKWFGQRIILEPRLEADYENAAVIALNPWKTPARWRAVYAGIGSRFGAYSICEAVSDDGLTWHRGEPDQNLALPPQGDGWESQMTEYPHVVVEGDELRMFYCGNGYGRTGIGLATAKMLD